MVDYYRFIMIDGQPSPFWITNRQLIHETIQKYGLEPVPAEFLSGFAAPLEGSEAAAAPLRIRRRDFCGGMKTPHLHYSGELYELKPEQWAEFSNKIISNCEMILAHAHTVTFENVLEVSHAIDGLSIQKSLPKK